MTKFLLQNIELEDAETAVKRSYFEWGRGRPEDSPEPEWDEATLDQRRSIALRAYNLYDGWPVQTGNEIGPLEIYLTIAINSRIVLNDVVRFLIRAEAARPLLAGIPDSAGLEAATDDQIQVAAELIDLFSAAYRIGRGKTTKVLHKKRPLFIPILDSVVGDFLWKNFPHLLTGQASTEQILHVFRLLLHVQSRPLVQIGAALAAEGFSLSPTRLLDFLIWIGWKDRVDQYGFGQPFTRIWGTSNLPDARAFAIQRWEEQCRS